MTTTNADMLNMPTALSPKLMGLHVEAGEQPDPAEHFKVKLTTLARQDPVLAKTKCHLPGCDAEGCFAGAYGMLTTSSVLYQITYGRNGTVRELAPEFMTDEMVQQVVDSLVERGFMVRMEDNNDVVHACFTVPDSVLVPSFN